jgi:hypothetical protein
MPGSLISVTRALYCCVEAYVAEAVLDSGKAGEEGGFSALISSLADETGLSERNGVQCEFARLGREVASPSANLRRCQKPAIWRRGLIDNRSQRGGSSIARPACRRPMQPCEPGRMLPGELQDADHE